MAAVALLLVGVIIVVSVAVGVAVELHFGERADRACGRILNLLLYVVVPPVIFFNIVHLDFTLDVGVGLLIGLLASVLTGVLAFSVGRARGWPRPVIGTVIISSVAGNTAYLGYPFAAIAFGSDALPEAVAYDSLVAIPVLVVGCFAVGAAFGESSGETLGGRVSSFFFRNPVLPAFVLALLAPDWLAPDLAVTLSQVLVFAMLPVGFVAVGVYLAESSAGRFSIPHPDLRIGTAVVLKLLALPGLLALIALPLIAIPEVYLVQAAMPSGLNTLIVANAYGLDRRLAAGAIVWSTGAVLLVAGAVAALSA